MSTKLEAVVGLLAGRPVDPGLLEELDDPSSEASRFLEATRNRSRALLDELSPRDRPDGAGRRRGDRRWVIALAIAATVLLTALGLALWAAEARLRRLEEGQARSQSEARSSASRLEAALNRLAESKSAGVSLDPIGATLGRLDRRMEGLERRADPTIAQLREEIALLRREITASEKGVALKTEELQALVHEAARLLKLQINQAQPPPSTERAPVFPPPRPTSGIENRRVTP
jgi:hypothetical protein